MKIREISTDGKIVNDNNCLFIHPENRSAFVAVGIAKFVQVGKIRQSSLNRVNELIRSGKVQVTLLSGGAVTIDRKWEWE